MNVLVSDTSVLIDLERGSLLETSFALTFRFAVPDLLYRQELAEHGGPPRSAAQRRGRSGEVASLVERRVAAQIRGPVTARGNWARDGAREFIARQNAPARAGARGRAPGMRSGR